MKYSKEQIEKAFMDLVKADRHFSSAALIAELEKPKPVFKVGEAVIADMTNGKAMIIAAGNEDPDSRWRHLNLIENPSTALALERLERLASRGWLSSSDGIASLSEEIKSIKEYSKQAIADIKKMVG